MSALSRFTDAINGRYRSFGSLFLGLFVLAFPLSVIAETPSEITRQLVREMSKKSSMDGVIDRVDWDNAFQQMDPAMRQQMGINSPEELKARQVEVYRGMGPKIQEGIERGAQTQDPKKAYAINAMRERLNASLQEQQRKAAQDFAETVFAVGEEKIVGTEATVELRKTRNGQTTTTQLPFVQVNGQWKLRTAAPLNPASNANPNEATSELLGPSISSPNEAVLRLH